jgi:hypothetical protein
MYDITEFIDGILVEYEETSEPMSPPVRDVMRQDLAKKFQQRTAELTLAQLPEDHWDAYEVVLRTGDPEKVWAFCVDNIPHWEQVVAAEQAKFRKLYLP